MKTEDATQTSADSAAEAEKGKGRLLLHYAQGLLMGTADVIPGVSGGTVALIVGIYERLILSISALASLPAALVRNGVDGALAQMRKVHWSLILPLGLGIVSAIVIGAMFIPDILERFPVESRAVFFGLIAGSLVVPWRRIERRHPILLPVGLAMAVAAFVIVGLPPRELVDPALLVVFVVASIAITAMILPGVSGAFLLLVMGMYEATLSALNARDLAFIVVFCAGAALGLALFSKVLGYLLTRYHDLTMAGLIGLMIGGLRALWPYIGENRELYAPPADTSALIVFGLMVGCAFLVLLLTGIGAARRRTQA